MTMLKKIMMVALLVVSVIAISETESTAYSYKGYSGCYGCGSYEGTWEVGGGGRSPSFLVSEFTLLNAALVCINPGTKQRDVRSGQGGIILTDFVTEEEFLL